MRSVVEPGRAQSLRGSCAGLRPDSRDGGSGRGTVIDPGLDGPVVRTGGRIPEQRVHEIGEVAIGGGIGAEIVRRARLAVAVHMGLAASLDAVGEEASRRQAIAPPGIDSTPRTAHPRRTPASLHRGGEVRE